MKYKLIKTYPGSPKLLTIISNDNGFIDAIKPQNYPEFWEKVIEEPLFTTEDGVDIFVGDKYWVLNTKIDDWIFEENAARDNVNYFYKDKSYSKNTGIYYFSSKEKAEEYIIMNKPCLSLNDVFNTVTWLDNSKQTLKQLVKSKLNK